MRRRDDWLEELWAGDIWSTGTSKNPIGLEQVTPALLCEYFGTTVAPSFEEHDDFSRGIAENAKMILNRYAPGEARPGRMIFAILQSMGYRVEFSRDLPKGRRGAIDFESGVIRINLEAYTANSKNTLERQVETAAHELGHLVLHEELLRAGVDLTEEHEREADEYGRLFLLPRRMLLHDVRLRGGSPNDGTCTAMAEEWCVSVGLMKERLKELGIQPSNQRARRIS